MTEHVLNFAIELEDDAIIKMAAEILADSFKRTKKWKEVACDAIEEVSK